MAQVNWSEKDEKYWVKDLKSEVLWFENVLDAANAARRIETERTVADEVARITTWLKAHGMRQVAMMIERGEYK
jgi:hypothetical protein